MSQGLFDRDVERRLRLLEAFAGLAGVVSLAGTPTAITTSAAVESASINTLVVANQGVAGRLQVAFSLAGTATVVADVFNCRIYVDGVQVFGARIATATTTSVATPCSITTSVAMAAGAMKTVTVTLQRASGTGTLASPAGTDGNSLTVLFVPD